MSETLAEIPYAAAEGNIREIYDNIMRFTGVGSPALIYRHFAVYPGFLEWVWDVIGPELENGYLVREAPARAAALEPVLMAPLSRDDIASMGVDDEGWKTVQAILATYNRMNPVNLALISAIRMILDDDMPKAEDVALPAPATEPPTPADKLPAPLNLAEMDPNLSAEILDLSASIPSPGEIVIPTLYRHFAIWPGLMLGIAPRLLVGIESGQLMRRMGKVRRAIRPLAGDVAVRASARGVGSAPLDDIGAMIETLETFDFVIPQLIAIGYALDAAMPDQ